MTSTVAAAVVPTPRHAPERTRSVQPPDREGTVRTPRPTSEYWDVTEARWRTAR